jgi:hypothetical protein
VRRDYHDERRREQQDDCPSRDVTPPPDKVGEARRKCTYRLDLAGGAVRIEFVFHTWKERAQTPRIHTPAPRRDAHAGDGWRITPPDGPS